MLGVSFGIPGGAWVALMEPLGAYENVTKTSGVCCVLSIWRFLGEPWGSFWSLGGCFEGPWGPWGVTGSSMRGPWGSLEGPWEDLGAPMREKVLKTNFFLTFPKMIKTSNLILRQPSRSSLEVLGGPRGGPRTL